MNWDAIGAIAELLGAIGVIASLVYLATQIRHSRDQMRAATHLQLNEFIGESATSLPPPDMELTRLGNEGSQPLSEEDAYRYNLWAMRMVISLESAHYQYRVGMLYEDRWRFHRFTLQGFLGSWRGTSKSVPPTEHGSATSPKSARERGGCSWR